MILGEVEVGEDALVDSTSSVLRRARRREERASVRERERGEWEEEKGDASKRTNPQAEELPGSCERDRHVLVEHGRSDLEESERDSGDDGEIVGSAVGEDELDEGGREVGEGRVGSSS